MSHYGGLVIKFGDASGSIFKMQDLMVLYDWQSPVLLQFIKSKF